MTLSPASAKSYIEAIASKYEGGTTHTVHKVTMGAIDGAPVATVEFTASCNGHADYQFSADVWEEASEDGSTFLYGEW